MIFIIGGSYQGQQEFACKEFNLTANDFFVCSEETSIDLTRPAIAHIERFALGCVRRSEEPADFWKTHRDALADKVLIADDISCGVVPVDPVVRAWREATGRANNYLAQEAEHVWRVFCGLGMMLK